jgi:uncharacterized integral membrane protein
MNKTKLIVAIVLAALAVIVVLQNTAAVETKLLFLTVTMPRVLLLFLMLAVGFISGILASLYWTKKKKEGT